jgi:tetratricopeptide (TPR) repeat protein
MAGDVINRKIPKYISCFWSIFVLLSFIIIFLGGCTRLQQSGGMVNSVSPEQKKAELKAKLDRKYEDPQTHFLLGQLYHADRVWDEAEFYYNNALRFDPVYRPAQAAMIKLCVDKGDTVKAKNYLDIYMNQAGESPDKLVDLARELQRQQMNTYALTCFNKALEIAPKSANVHKYLGYFYLSQNEKEKASEHFQESFKIDSSQYDVARELGKLGVPIIYDAKPPQTKQQTQETPK